MKLPNGASILIGVVLVAALTALAGELPNSAEGWLPLAGAAVIAGIAKAVQVWFDAQQQSQPDGVHMERLNKPSSIRAFFIG